MLLWLLKQAPKVGADQKQPLYALLMFLIQKRGQLLKGYDINRTLSDI
jgi:hypothetical protein